MLSAGDANRGARYAFASSEDAATLWDLAHDRRDAYA